MAFIFNHKFLLKNVLILSIILLQPFSVSIYASESPQKNSGVAVGSTI